MEAMDKIAEDMEDEARQHNSKILYWHFNKLRGSSQSGLVPVKDRNGATISDKDRVKETWVEHFEDVLNRDTVAGKDIDENEKVCDILDVTENLFCEEELATVLKGLKINMALGADSVINEYLKYGGSEIRNKILLLLLLIIITTHRSTKPPEVSTATYAPPLTQSIQGLPFNTLPGSSHFLLSV